MDGLRYKILRRTKPVYLERARPWLIFRSNIINLRRRVATYYYIIRTKRQTQQEIFLHFSIICIECDIDCLKCQYGRIQKDDSLVCTRCLTS